MVLLTLAGRVGYSLRRPAAARTIVASVQIAGAAGQALQVRGR